MSLKDVYSCEIELSDGTIISDSTEFDEEKVVRVSFVPSVPIFPRHDLIFSGFKFVRRFGRDFIKLSLGQKEYLHCVVTDKFRFYLKCSNGQCIITDKDYELYL